MIDLSFIGEDGLLEAYGPSMEFNSDVKYKHEYDIHAQKQRSEIGHHLNKYAKRRGIDPKELKRDLGMDKDHGSRPLKGKSMNMGDYRDNKKYVDEERERYEGYNTGYPYVRKLKGFDKNSNDRKRARHQSMESLLNIDIY